MWRTTESGGAFSTCSLLPEEDRLKLGSLVGEAVRLKGVTKEDSIVEMLARK